MSIPVIPRKWRLEFAPSTVDQAKAKAYTHRLYATFTAELLKRHPGLKYDWSLWREKYQQIVQYHPVKTDVGVVVWCQTALRSVVNVALYGMEEEALSLVWLATLDAMCTEEGGNDE